MFIKKIIGHNFRNFEKIDISFDKPKNLILGENGIGKTNLIESIFFLSTCRGFKKNDLKSLIKEGCKQADLFIEYDKENEEHSLSAIIQNKNKTFAYDKEEKNKLSDIFGKILTICYVPQSAYLFKNEPSARRSFIDELCSQLDKEYLHYLQRYRKLLKERNQAFIKDYDQDIIDVYKKQLINLSFKIVSFRTKILKDINMLIENYFNKMFGVESKLNITYHTNCSIKSNVDEFTKEMNQLFDSNKSSEHIYKQTLIGPHKDNLKAYLNDKDISIYGSQGQNRLATLSLQLIKRDIYKKYLNVEPVLILDDVLSDLDDIRSSNLLDVVSSSKQVIITGTKVPQSTKLNDYAIYRIKDNNIYKE